MKNRFDTRNRGADEIFYDLRMLRGENQGPVVLAIMGQVEVDASDLARALSSTWSVIVKTVGWQPQRLMTSDRPVGTEKAVRLAAKELTGNLAVVVHRAELTYGIRLADETCCNLLAREADALLYVGRGGKFLRDRFAGIFKPIHEVSL